uniref:Secreted protein n=1 Tax=Pyxicephalus adspersus TaxID=30357 RepID=A0AAV3AEX5_PYXAD|nr:TPA: hypothetical protein GDO54_018147 [Pyxicephalus adspersus]
MLWCHSTAPVELKYCMYRIQFSFADTVAFSGTACCRFTRPVNWLLFSPSVVCAAAAVSCFIRRQMMHCNYSSTAASSKQRPPCQFCPCAVL